MINGDRPGVAAEGAQLRVGDVFAQAWPLLSRHLTFFVAVAGIGRLPYLILDIVWPTGTGHIWRHFFLMAGITTLFSPLTAAVITYSVVSDLEGQPANGVSCVRSALRWATQLIGSALIVEIGFWLGFVLLIVPGFIVSSALALAGTACLMERIGPWQSIRRSLDLTRGSRWRILLTLLSVMLPYLVAFESIRFGIGQKQHHLAAELFSYPLAVFFDAFIVVLCSVIYYTQRTEKEGPIADEIAAVFD